MKTYFAFFALIILLLLVKVVSAQDQKLIFHYVPPPPGGLGNGGLTCVQDLQGYMWFAFVGVHRYDGYKYKSYFNDPLDSNSLATDFVEALCADHNGFIWIGTRFSGLDRLDPATGHFTHFRHNPKNNNSVSSDTIRALLEDKEGIIWIGTDSGLNRYDPRTGMFQHYTHDPKDAHSLSCDHVNKIYEDRKGVLWVGTGSIWHGEGGETDEGGLNRLDKNTGKFTRYLHEPNNVHSLINNKVRSIFEDSRGTFWVGTAGDGLHTMNRTNGSFERHLYDPTYPDKLSRPSVEKSNLPGSTDGAVTFIAEDITGSIWIGTLDNGVNRYDYRTNRVEHYPNFKDPVSGIQTSWASWAYTSIDGMLWIGYWQGIFLINPLQNTKSYFNTGPPVNDIVEDADGMLWYGTENGLVRKDQSTGAEKRFVYDPHNPHSISDNHILSIYEDRQGVLWIGTTQGLNRFDPKKDAFTRYVINSGKNNSAANVSVQALFEDSHGSFWLGTGGAGLVLLNRQDGSYKHYFYNLEDFKNYQYYSEITCICKDRHGHLWAGSSWYAGLNEFIPRTGKFQRFLKGADVLSLCMDSKGILWVGTEKGLYQSNPSLNSFSRFPDPSLELPENTIVNGILEDDQKALWINTFEGIYRLNPARNEVVRYSKHEGQGFGYNKGKKGELFFGSATGYYIFLPEQLIKNSKPPKIVLDEFRLGDRRILPDKEGPLKDPLSQVKEIQLRHDQNVFSFGFIGIHYNNPENIQLLFMLENLDKTWHKAGEEKKAYYYNIPPGDYVFHVKAANSDGVWAEKTIAIIVNPPWWRTWWAYTLFALLFAGLMYAFIQYRISRIRMQHEIVVQKHKAADLEHKAAELEMQALRAQMNPHFIFNCLNAINGFILKNDSETAADYLTKFSRLIRMVLNNSQKKFISLDEELETLGLYLYMENLRFTNNFHYNIHCDDSIDASSVFIPPMLLQPFAENAIWHGLMHKQGEGHLRINIHQEESVLICTITDDGVGRKKAAILKSKSAEKNKSMGLQITKNRMALLNQDFNGQSFFEIHDLQDEYGNAAGTSVSLKIKIREAPEENVSEHLPEKTMDQ